MAACVGGISGAFIGVSRRVLYRALTGKGQQRKMRTDDGVSFMHVKGTGGVIRRPTSQEGDAAERNGQPAAVESVEPSDSQLVRLVQGGDGRAFGVLVQRYGERILNTCLRICGHYDDARDLSQDTFLHAFRRIGDFRSDSRFFTWLYRIAVNVSISHRRRMKYRAATSLDAMTDPEGGNGPQIADPLEESPDQTVDRSERHSRLIAALDRLDEDHRTVVVLRDMEGLSYTEIAEVLDVPVGTVRSRLHRARSELLAVVEPIQASATSCPSRT